MTIDLTLNCNITIWQLIHVRVGAAVQVLASNWSKSNAECDVVYICSVAAHDVICTCSVLLNRVQSYDRLVRYSIRYRSVTKQQVDRPVTKVDWHGTWDCQINVFFYKIMLLLFLFYCCSFNCNRWRSLSRTILGRKPTRAITITTFPWWQLFDHVFTAVRRWHEKYIFCYCVATQKVCEGTQKYCVPLQSLRTPANFLCGHAMLRKVTQSA